ncbi:MAG TPA: hypothetical protein VFB16_06760 [Bauldia sp.]|nr:hypothetical protein [Bauldia sp.]
MPEANEAPSPQAAAAAIRIAPVERSLAGFGAVVDYLAGIEPFSRYDFGNFSAAIRFQVLQRCNLCAFAGPRLAGYCGWLPTSAAIAQAWIEGTGQLQPVRNGDVVAVTIVAAKERATLRPLIAAARKLNAGKRFYFRRDYAGSRTARKASVADVRPG